MGELNEYPGIADDLRLVLERSVQPIKDYWLEPAYADAARRLRAAVALPERCTARVAGAAAGLYQCVAPAGHHMPREANPGSSVCQCGEAWRSAIHARSENDHHNPDMWVEP